jgi:hypothetical protein
MGKGFESKDGLLLWVFWCSAAVALGLVAISVYLLARSIHGYRYKRMPFLSEVAVHYQKLVDYYDGRGTPGLAGQAFNQYLAKWYTAITDYNTVNNFQRGEYLYRANRFVVYALCATAFAAVPAGIAVKTARPVPQDVRITNLRSDALDIVERGGAERSRVHAADGPRSRIDSR